MCIVVYQAKQYLKNLVITQLRNLNIRATAHLQFRKKKCIHIVFYFKHPRTCRVLKWLLEKKTKILMGEYSFFTITPLSGK